LAVRNSFFTPLLSIPTSSLMMVELLSDLNALVIFLPRSAKTMTAVYLLTIK